MKIALNATSLNNRASGARQRFIGIYNELFRLLRDDEFVVYEPVDCQMSSWFEGAENVSFKQTPLSSQKRLQKFLRGLAYWPLSLKKEQTDIFETFHLPIVKSPTGRTLLTIHDIREMNAQGVGGVIYKAVLERSLNAADQVITVSESMRNEILEFYPDLPISVVYNGIDTNNFDVISDADLFSVRHKFGLPEDFLLSVGHFEKRKNYLNLVDALAILHARGSSINLVIIGNDSGEMNTVKERARSLGLSKQVIIFNGLSDFDVRCIYKLCTLFVFASAYEGFGIPVLEAMAAKRPIILSDIPVFREITQNQGIYFAHDDADSIATTIDDVLTSNSECGRLIHYGCQRVQDFSFKNLSLDLARVYQVLS